MSVAVIKGEGCEEQSNLVSVDRGGGDCKGRKRGLPWAMASAAGMYLS